MLISNFPSIKREYFSSPSSQGDRVTPTLNSLVPILYTWVEWGAEKVKCLNQEVNSLTPARAWTQD